MSFSERRRCSPAPKDDDDLGREYTLYINFGGIGGESPRIGVEWKSWSHKSSDVSLAGLKHSIPDSEVRQPDGGIQR